MEMPEAAMQLRYVVQRYQRRRGIQLDFKTESVVWPSRRVTGKDHTIVIVHARSPLQCPFNAKASGSFCLQLSFASNYWTEVTTRAAQIRGRVMLAPEPSSLTR
jgi:hypothetical protein